jgi:hypothetical protein
MKSAVFIVLLTLVNLLSFSQNLTVNPGFEEWDKPDKPTGWTTDGNCLKDSDNTNSGRYSCRQNGGTNNIDQTLSIVPGKRYRFSFFYKTAIIESGNGCRIWCYWKDAKNKNLTDSSTDKILRPSKYLKSNTWHKFTIDFAAPAGASSFYLEVRTYQNSIAWFDDFDFEENVPTIINPEEKFQDIKLYPNPVCDHLFISNLINITHVYIQNLEGRTVWSSGFNGEQLVTIPVSGFANGIYLVIIRTSDKLITKKIVKKGN